MLIYAVYLGARVYGFHYSDPDALALGADWLAIGKRMSQILFCVFYLLLHGVDDDRCRVDLSKIGFCNPGE